MEKNWRRPTYHKTVNTQYDSDRNRITYFLYRFALLLTLEGKHVVEGRPEDVAKNGSFWLFNVGLERFPYLSIRRLFQLSSQQRQGSDKTQSTRHSM